MRVTILGLGHMGIAAAERLHSLHYDVTVWNRSPGKAAELVQRGVKEAATVAAAAAGADVVITLLTDDAAVGAVCLGEGGVLEVLGSDTILVDMSTVHPDTSRALGKAVPGNRF